MARKGTRRWGGEKTGNEGGGQQRAAVTRTNAGGRGKIGQDRGVLVGSGGGQDQKR